MKIEKLHIDGFGIFHDKTIQGFTKGINVLYGANEAGKSTLLDFIRFTLFEYPRYIVDRRTPIYGGDHSGTIWMKNSSKEKLSVYRHGNAKDFQLEYNGKTSENETLYHKLTGNASIDLYKNIYAITLDELNDVEQLDDSGMKDRIFSMGMGLSGVDFGGFEKDLINHSEEYFLTRGSVQILPKLVNEIKNKEESISELRSKLGEYNQLSEEKERLEKELETSGDLRKQLREEKNTFSDLAKAYSDYVKYKEAVSQIEAIGSIELHSNKILEQYEKQKQKLADEEAAITRINQQIQQSEEQIKELKWDEELSKQAGLLDFFKTNVKLYEEAKTKRDREKEKLSHAKSRSESILNRLGDEVKSEHLINLEGTFELQSKATQFVEEQQKLNRLIDTKSEVVSRLTQEVAEIKSRKEKIEQEINKHNIQNKTDRAEENDKKIALDTAFKVALKGKGGSSYKSNKLPLVLSIVFTLVGLGLMLYNLVSGSIVLGLALVGLLVVLLQKKKNPVETYSGKDPNSINTELEAVKEAIQRYDQMTEKHDEIEQQFTLKNKEYQKATQALKDLEKEEKDLIHQWQDLLQDQKLPTTLAPSSMNDFMSNVEELKRQKEQRVEAEKSIQNIDERIANFENKLQRIVPDKKDLEVSYVYTLIKKMEENEEIHTQRQQLLEQITNLSKDKEIKQESVRQVKNEIDELFTSLQVKEESAFYKHFEEQEVHEQAQSQKQSAANTIKTLCGADQLEETIERLKQFTPSELNAKKEETQANYEEVENRYEELNKELATISTKIKVVLEVDDMYAYQNEKESLQAQLKEETKEWLATQLALNVLNQSKQKYEKERQPEVITQTREFFRTITENAYEDLRISLSEKHVSIIDAAGNSKKINALSRGTKEQLLLSLRLGLIAEYEKNAEPLPVAFDDIMVNSDKERTKNLVELITDFGKDRQVLYFTCHEHTKELFASHGANIITW